MVVWGGAGSAQGGSGSLRGEGLGLLMGVLGALWRVLAPWVPLGRGPLGHPWALKGKGGSPDTWGGGHVGARGLWGRVGVRWVVWVGGCGGPPACPGCLGHTVNPVLPAGKEYAKADSRYMT